MQSTPLAAILDGSFWQGLTVVTYKGGENFSVAPTALHLSHPSFAPSVALRARVCAAAEAALLVEARDAFMYELKNLPAAGAVDWEAAEWSRELVIAGAPPTFTSAGYVNMYFHGFLFPNGVEALLDESGCATAHPLVALLAPRGSLAHCPAGEPVSAYQRLPADGGLQAAEQHVHDLLYLGSDGAQATLTGKGAGAGVVVCVELRKGVRPRVRVADLVVLPSAADFEAVAAAVGGLGAAAPCELAGVLQRAIEALPALGEILKPEFAVE